MRKPDGTFAHGHAAQYKHGKRRSAIYSTWRNMRTRCENQNCEFYPDYGGRGIAVCEEWKSFEVFYADMGDAPAGMTLDRIDNDKGYSRDNCRWASKLEQSRNRRGRRMITALGETKSVAEWEEATGIGMATILYRLRKGWAADRIVSTPVRAMSQAYREAKAA